jgi:antiviral defense system Shedu protein SduA
MKEADWIEKPNGIWECYIFDSDKPDERHLVYIIDDEKKEITFIPDDDFAVNSVLLDGFDKLPDEFSEAGYIKAGLMYYLSKKLNEQNITDFIISDNDRCRIRRLKSGKKLVLNYSYFADLKNQLTEITNEAKKDRSLCVDEFFYRTFPRQFSKVTITSKSRASKVIRNLRPDIVEHLTPDDVASFLDFIEILLKTKYKSQIHKRKLFNSAKIKIDDLTISEVIDDFEQMLLDNPSESKWGTFLKRNLFLIDSKYVYALPELNVVLANCRKVDFGLIDSQGFLDIFEIKKPSTPILSSRTDRGNYYWSTDAIKAIVQAEKYLFHAERKASSLAEDVGTQRGKKVRVIRPRAFVLLGHSDELTDENRDNDFRILRMSLKNVEVILYDELLERIKHQKGKLYID